jgi:hypothetical protein
MATTMWEVETNLPGRPPLSMVRTYPEAAAKAQDLLDEIEARTTAYDVLRRHHRQWWVKLYRVSGQERHRQRVGALQRRRLAGRTANRALRRVGVR